MGMRTALLIGSLGLGLLACGGSAPPANNAAPPARTTQAQVGGKPAQPTAAPSAPGTLKRSMVREVVAQGPGRFLQRVSLADDPVMRNGKFYGFKIATLNDHDFFNGVDLAPGDVVTGVNGMTIERPENFLDAFRALDTAKELRVSIERDGKPRELKWAIVDDDR